MDNRSIFIYRNYTVEPLFSDFPGISYSGYEDISNVPPDASIYVWFYSCPLIGSRQEFADKINDYKKKLELVLVNSNPSSYVLLFTLAPVLNFYFTTNKKFLVEAISEYNQFLYSKAGTSPLIKVIEFENFIRQSQENQIIDWRYYFLYKTLINPGLSRSFSAWFRRQLLAIEGKRKKCFVLDLDNTLWGGVLGEDGLEGIQLGNSYPGNAFKDFQKMLHEAVKNGVLLAIASKNNEDEVWDAMKTHPDMILEKNDFVSWRINWNDKSTSIYEIANELNISTDSIVFIDDNPVERNWVSQSIPEVVVPEFPKHPYQLISFFCDVYDSFFQLYDLTGEDKDKLVQYKQNSLRNQSLQSFLKIEDYIASLNIMISVKEADSFTIPRIAQLTQKTNQFNLTTRRYTEADISSLIYEGHKVYSASVKDKFGDNGITAVCILKIISTTKVEIDTMLLSCRILGRLIEFALMKKLLNMLQLDGIDEVHALYIPSAKNEQAASFYDKLGFEVLEHEASKSYTLRINNQYKIEPYYRFEIL